MFGGGNKPNLFGTPTSTTGTAGGSLFNLNTSAGSTPQSAGSLFGTPTPAAGTTTGGGGGGGTGLFGNAGAATTSAPATPSLFGNPTATAPTPASGGGLSLFGKPANTTTTTSTAPAAPSLFGSTPAAGTAGVGAAATSSTPSLFSTTTTTTSAPGLFGSTPAPSSSSGTSLFQNPTPKPSIFTPAPSTSSLFNLGSTATNPTSTTAPATSTTQSTQPTTQSTTQQQNQPNLQSAVKVELYNLAPYHKFHELNDALRSEVESAEKYILSEIQKCEALSALFPEHREMVQSVRTDAELMERRLMTANSFLQSDSATLESLINHQKQDDQHASLSVRTLDLLRQPHASRIIQAQQQASAAGGSMGGIGIGPGGPTTPGIPGMNLNLSTNPLASVSGMPGGVGAGQPMGDTFGPLPTLSSTNTSELDITSNAGMISYFNRHGAEMEARLKQFLESVSEVEASLRSVEVQAARKSANRGLLGFDPSSGGVGVGGVAGVGGADGGAENPAESRQDEARRLNRALREFYAAMSDTAGRLVDAKEGLREVKATVQKEGLVGQGMYGGMGRSMRR